MLRAQLLRRGDLTAPVASPPWTDLATRLRAFIRQRVACDADADDVLQDVLLKMHSGLPTLRQHQRLSPWVFQIARNSLVDHFRKRGSLAAAMIAPERVTSDEDDEPHRELQAALSQYVASIVADLPSPYREAITLTEIEGLSQKDAAAMLGIEPSSMRSRVQRGRARLRKMLDECCKIELDARGQVIACEPRTAEPTSEESCEC